MQQACPSSHSVQTPAPVGLGHVNPRGYTEALLAQIEEQPIHRALGLTDWELQRICELLGREPNHFELAVFSLLWSEHCGYKHSALLLKKFPTTGDRVLQGPGENAGVVDLGGGEAVAFKVESHNHPSAVEPFQGAATGVGGILRDIYAMGARPVALLDGLYFGQDDIQFENAVAGIGTYGNCVGVPNVGGATFFDSRYAGNCLVNAMCVGLLPREQLTSARASGVGSVVMFGATTGRDGIGGASVLASQELGEDDADKRPSVQVGDPFTGKKLIEVSVELIEKNLVESLQDCGAAGLASALSEMAASFGLDIHLDRVPLRESDLEPWEIMVSESQERMVAAVTPSLVPAVKEVCAHWELPCTEIGKITDTGVLRCFWKGEVVGDIPARFLTEDAPRYQLEFAARPKQDPPLTPVAPPFRQALLELLGSDNIRDRAWVYERYDYIVGSRTVRRPGLDAGVIRLRPSLRGLALSLDGNGRIAFLDPRTGGAHAVLESARNVACAGGEPLAITNCLNFGNPEKPEMAWELNEAIEGIAETCEALGIPVVSGNVSLYNETDGQPIYPTPVVGCVGLVPDVRYVTDAWREGDVVLLAGEPQLSIAGSEYQALYDRVYGAPAELDLEAEAALVRFLWKNNRFFSIAHDVAEGGLAVCLAECAIASGIGARVDLPADPVQLFGECGGLAVVACAREHVGQLEAGGVPLREIGTAGGDSLNGLPLGELTRAWQAEGVTPESTDRGQ
jgi:phosphoribosylformylglycinamidine synthase